MTVRLTRSCGMRESLASFVLFSLSIEECLENVLNEKNTGDLSRVFLHRVENNTNANTTLLQAVSLV